MPVKISAAATKPLQHRAFQNLGNANVSENRNGRGRYKYSSIPSDQARREEEERLVEHLKLPRRNRKKRNRLVVMAFLGGFLVVVIWAVFSAGNPNTTSCDSVAHGYECQPSISHFWGQYSSYFQVPSNISTTLPSQCTITFAQILSRHGARDPTASKTLLYNDTIQQIQSSVKNFTGKYGFLADYEYTLGADQLTLFGQQQMVNSGIKFYEEYEELTRSNSPFVRSSGQDRVVESAMNWTEGFHLARSKDIFSRNSTTAPIVNVIISEDEGANNTLNHGLCTSFENDFDSTISDSAQSIFMETFIPPITTRLNTALTGANLTDTQTIYMMDLCPFNTFASPTGKMSPFCALFEETEWHSYNYYQTLGKFYGYSYGNPLGPTQGVGFVNELISRLTNTPVMDHTSTNSTLDNNPVTFPLNGTKLYADFSHDNDLTAIFSAMGLYNESALNGTMQFEGQFLSNRSIEEVGETGGYSAAWTVPFAGRMVVEKMECGMVGGSVQEELVRILINDRVVRPTGCPSDDFGRCKLSEFVEGLGFARGGGDWGECFV